MNLYQSVLPRFFSPLLSAHQPSCYLFLPSPLSSTHFFFFYYQHWTYTLDLVDSYLAVFPDKESQLLWDSEPVPFYLSPAVVKPRADRYKIVPNSNKPGTSTVRVYSAVSGQLIEKFYILYS